jgi:magnesium-transporting ATPase (P-type)
MFIIDGKGIVLIFSVGLNTLQGNIYQILRENNQQTPPLPEKLQIVSSQIEICDIFISALTFICLIGGFLINKEQG